MPDDLEKLYQDLILDHYRHPRYAAEIGDGEADAEKLNPTCGDRVRLRLTLEDGVITTLHHDTSGCAVARASSSLMADVLQGVSVEKAGAVLAAVLNMMASGDADMDLGDLRALHQVRAFPLRVRCATLPWLALRDVLDDL